ncbi:MAG: site-specific integrase [Candidatus Nanopelagicales bacterium]
MATRRAARKVTRPARFGGVRQLASGRYQARYKRDGKTYPAPDTFATEEDAWAWLTTVEASVVTGSWQAPNRVTPNLAEFGDRWITTHPRVKATTRAEYELTFTRHVEPYLGHLRLREITPGLVRQWQTNLKADLKASIPKGKRTATTRDGSATAARAYRLLTSICNAAIADRYLEVTPCTIPDAGRPHGRAGYEERPTLSAAEVGALADTVPERYRALVLVLAWAGLRIGEAAALRRCDMDLTPGAEAVRVSERAYYVAGRVDYDSPKSHAGKRRVPLPPHVASVLADHLGRFTGPDEDSLVFTTRTGGNCVNVAGPVITRRLDGMGRTDVRVYDLRHTGNTLAAIAGASQAELMRRMGHASADAAAGYLHTVEDHGRAVAQALSDVATGVSVVPLASRRRRSRAAG